MLMIRKVHISPLAVPSGTLLAYIGSALRRSSSSSFKSSMAFNPAGVAAQPSPRTLAMRLAEMEPTAGWPHGSSGNKKWINGVIFLVNASITPARSPIFKIPVQKDMIPSMVMHRLTASPADWKAASVTAWMFPLKLPYMIPAIIMNAQSPFSILVCPWSFFHYMKKIG